MISRVIFVVAAFFLAACQSLQPLPSVGPGTKTRVGQLRYDMRSRTVLGDVVLSSLSSGDYDLEFSKGGLPVLQIQTRGDRMRATGMLARRGWSGSTKQPPAPLKPWAMLKEIIPHFDNTKETKAENSSVWSANFQRKREVLSRAKVQFSTGESMVFNFAQ